MGTTVVDRLALILDGGKGEFLPLDGRGERA